MEVHHCIHCGTESQPTWRFCRRCGTALENLYEASAIAHCSNCAGPVAEGWRFCANCGTSTEGASPVAAPATAAEPAPVPPAGPPHTADPAKVVAEEVPLRPELVEEAPAPTPPAADKASNQPDPAITAIDVSFEPADPAATFEAKVVETAPPPPPADLPTAPQPPPHDIAADAPPLPPGAPPTAPEPVTQAMPEIAPPEPTPDADRFGLGASQEADREAQRETSRAAEGSPAVVIPPAPDRGDILPEIPRPLGSPQPITRSVPERIGATPAAEIELTPEPTTQEAPRPRVAVPDRPAPRRPEPKPDLPPVDSRIYQNPGLFGQGVQLALLATAAVAVAMIVALTVLNNRLDAYAKTGESLARVDSAEKIINFWLRPLLAVAVIATYVLLVMWARRVTRNLEVLDRDFPETALWMWVIPGANIFVLYQHLDAAWKGSDIHSQHVREWRKGRPDWWNFGLAILVIIAFGLIIFAWTLGADTFETAIDANAISLIGYALLSASLLCGVKAVGNVIERQRTRVEAFD